MPDTFSYQHSKSEFSKKYHQHNKSECSSRKISAVRVDPVRSISAVITDSIRNVSNNEFNKQRCSKNEFSKKYQQLPREGNVPGSVFCGVKLGLLRSCGVPSNSLSRVFALRFYTPALLSLSFAGARRSIPVQTKANMFSQ